MSALPISPITQLLSLTDSGLLDSLRSSLEAKQERLLRRPLIAKIAVDEGDQSPPPSVSSHDLFQFLDADLKAAAPKPQPLWETIQAGVIRLPIAIDYADLWRGYENEVIETVRDTIENDITFLTTEQFQLLRRCPREFLSLQPKPETVELIGFEEERIGGSRRVTALHLAAAPDSPRSIRHVAIVPNLIALERQLAALHILEHAPTGGVLAPLRALLGLEALPVRPPVAENDALIHATGPLDAFQRTCIGHALRTPHFARIQGPPGSGKTTVIQTIAQSALQRGERVLVVSPTHVAVDNVVEKLTKVAADDDILAPHSLPVRYAAKKSQLLPAALPYWVSRSDQKRGATVARRVEQALRRKNPAMARLFDAVDPDKKGYAPLSAALTQADTVCCGTPIGILSHEPVKLAKPGSFDLLIVDEVSKMTLPEFLAIAVKAKRWVLVGDPLQLPPYNDIEENGTTLDDLLAPPLELACSVGAILERMRPAERGSLRLVVVAQNPHLATPVIQSHIDAVGLSGSPKVVISGYGLRGGIVVCQPGEECTVAPALSGVHRHERTRNPHRQGSVQLLVERGVVIQRPQVASGLRLVEPRLRSGAAIFEKVFNVFHAQPWARRARQQLSVLGFRHGLKKCLPSIAALQAMGHDPAQSSIMRAQLIDAIAERIALNAISVFDWLGDIPHGDFDVSPMRELEEVMAPLDTLRAAVVPFTGVLVKQYRMHSSISRVPRRLFYNGEALQDGRASDGGNRVRFIQVHRSGPRSEDNSDEAEAIVDWLEKLSQYGKKKRPPTVLVITPYRAQEALLRRSIDTAQRSGGLAHVTVEICTLDRCQGREADMVFISLVRRRATPFLDAPKRWNVALTRAQNGLFLFGDIEAYRFEAAQARQQGQMKQKTPRMSLLARIIESYQEQVHHAPSRQGAL